MRKILYTIAIIVLLGSVSGCALVNLALSAGIAYGIAEATK